MKKFIYLGHGDGWGALYTKRAVQEVCEKPSGNYTYLGDCWFGLSNNTYFFRRQFLPWKYTDSELNGCQEFKIFCIKNRGELRDIYMAPINAIGCVTFTFFNNEFPELKVGDVVEYERKLEK